MVSVVAAVEYANELYLVSALAFNLYGIILCLFLKTG